MDTYVASTDVVRFADQTASTWYAHMGSRGSVEDYDLRVVDMMDSIVEGTPLTDFGLEGVSWVYGAVLRRAALPGIRQSRSIWWRLRGIAPAPAPSPTASPNTTTTSPVALSPSPSTPTHTTALTRSPTPTPTRPATRSRTPTRARTETDTETRPPVGSGGRRREFRVLDGAVDTPHAAARRTRHDPEDGPPVATHRAHHTPQGPRASLRAVGTSAKQGAVAGSVYAPLTRSKIDTVMRRKAETAVFRDVDCLQSDPLDTDDGPPPPFCAADVCPSVIHNPPALCRVFLREPEVWLFFPQAVHGPHLSKGGQNRHVVTRSQVCRPTAHVRVPDYRLSTLRIGGVQCAPFCRREETIRRMACEAPRLRNGCRGLCTRRSVTHRKAS